MFLGLMEGRRNHRFLRWGVIILLMLTCIYIFYLYRDLKVILREREERLEAMDALKSKVSEEMRDLIEDHTKVREDLNNERVAHQATRREKENLGIKCEDDLRTLKDSCENEKALLTTEKENYMQAANDESVNNRHLRDQHTQLTERYNRDMTSCSEEKEKLRSEFQLIESRSNADVTRLKQELQDAQTTLRNMENIHDTCNTELEDLRKNHQLMSLQVSSFESGLSDCQKEKNELSSKNLKLQQTLDSMSKQQQRPEVRIQNNQQNPSDINRKQREAPNGRWPNQPVGQFDSQFPKPPPGQQLQQGQGQGWQSPDRPRMGQDGSERRQRVEGGQGGMEYGQKDGQGAIYKQEGGMGMENQPQQQQPLPRQQDEQEEVKELRLEDQDPIDNKDGNLEDMVMDDIDAGKDGGRDDDDDNGMDEQAFNPETQEEEQLNLRDDEQKTEEERQNEENLNLPPPNTNEDNNPVHQLPNPARVQSEDDAIHYDRGVNPGDFDGEKLEEDGDRQFQRDMEFDRLQRLDRHAGRGEEGADVRQEMEELNRRREMVADMHRYGQQQQGNRDILR